MDSGSKIASIKSLLTAFGRRKKASGIAWAEAFNDEQTARETIDPAADMYDRVSVTAKGMIKKVGLLSPVSDLDQETAERMVTLIAPKALCRFDGLVIENARGCVEALAFVSAKYPEVAEFLQCYSSIDGAHQRNKEELDKYIETIRDDQESREHRDELQRWLDGYKVDKLWTSEDMARMLGVKDEKTVNDWLDKNGRSKNVTEELIEICKAARIEMDMREYLLERAGAAVETLDVPDERRSYLAIAQGFNRAVFMSSKKGSAEDYDVVMKRCESRGYHPKIDPEHHGAKAVMVHEFGHIILNFPAFHPLKSLQNLTLR